LSSRMLCPSVGDTGYLTEEIPGSARDYSSSANLYNWIAKLDYRPLSNHNLSLSYVGSPTTTGGTTGGSGPPSTRQSDELNNTQDVVAHLVSKLFDHRLQLDIVGGWHYETDGYTYPTAEGNGPRISYSGTMPLSTFEPVPECDVQTIHGVTFSPCPVSGWT